MKHCSTCGMPKHLDDFYGNLRGADGRRGECKACISVKRKQRYEVDGEILKDRVLRYNLKHKYGMQVEDYQRMLEAQGGACAICNLPERFVNRRLAVDHDHESGEVRGLLCSACNTALGMFQDDIGRLHAAAEYLARTMAASRS